VRLPFRRKEEREAPRSAASRIFDVALWIAVLGLLAWRFGPQLFAVTGVGASDQPAPAFELTSLDGATIHSDSLAGSVVLVNFWATWCAPCRLEMPGIDRVWRQERDAGFVVIGIATDETGEAGVRAFVDERAVSYPIAMATPEVIRAFGGYRGLPTSILIDRAGRIRYRITGFYVEPALRAAVTRLLGESAPPDPR